MDTKITADGEYRINAEHSMSKSIVYIRGDTGGATLSLKGFDGYLLDGTLTQGNQYQVHHGVDAPLTLEVVGSSGANMTIRCVGIH